MVRIAARGPPATVTSARAGSITLAAVSTRARSTSCTKLAT